VKVLAVVGGALVTGGLLGVVGLRVTPASLPDPDVVGGEITWVALPDGLPPPVERFYTTLYGEEVPVVDSAVLSGRGTMRVNGLTLPVRWRFTHDAGRAYRHHIEATFLGRRLLSVHETYRDGVARLELPFGVSEGPQVDQGANLALWAEAVWLPAIWVTDERVRWEPVDEHTALLVLPGPDGEEVAVARFDPGSGLLRLLESMRFKGEDAEERTLWLNDAERWGEVDGWTLPIETSVTWLDDGSPWARLTTEQVIYNADVTALLEHQP
jgi:hypothetical protein